MRRTLGLIAVATTASLALACAPSAHDRATSRPPAIAVQTTRAVVTDVADALEAGGIVAASESAVVSSRIVAPVLTVRVRAGDLVRAGDVLATLDARDASAQAREAAAAAQAAEQALVQARSEEIAAAADHKLADAWHTRMALLRDRNSATAQEFDEAEARLTSAAAREAGAQAGIGHAAARLQALRAAADAAATTESYTVLRAPFAGVVTERFTDPGNLASPGMPLLRLDAGGPRRVEVRVDEARVAYVHPGDRVPVWLDIPNADIERARPVEGTVTEVARAVTPDQRAFTVKVALAPNLSPRTGTFARVRFRGETRRAVVVPADAVRRNGQLTSVFVVQGGTARLRLVQAGDVDERGTQVLAGLDPGEMVITAPPPALVDGHPVTVSTSLASAMTGGRR